MIIKKLKRLKDIIYSFYRTYEIFYASLPERTSSSVEDLSQPFIIEGESVALDIGCGRVQSNPFKSNKVDGLDLFEDKSKNIFKCALGFEAIPFSDNSFDFVTAFDLLEHIPRHSVINGEVINPFIFLMNEIYRVMKPGGIFLSQTPIYPFAEAFQDPTHNNIMTSETFSMYFSDKKFDLSADYGIKTSFKIIKQYIRHRHLIAFLSK